MPGSFNNYLENELLDHVFGGSDYPRPATLYFALFTVAPTDAGGGTEVAGGAYARVAVTNNPTNFPAASGGSKSNGTAVTFPKATLGWGVIVAVGIFDASSGGNMLGYSTITNKTIDIDDTVTIAAGALTITLD